MSSVYRESVTEICAFCVSSVKKMELYKGRPESTQGRLEKEIRVYDLLDSLHIEYVRTDHEKTDTMEACNEIDAIHASTHPV